MCSILIVDQSESAHARLARCFQPNHYHIVDCNSPEEALAHIAQGERFDLLITDLQLQGTNGIELFERMAAAHPAAPAVIFITPSDFDSDLVAEVLRRPAPVIFRPVDASRLRKEVSASFSCSK
ncbi:MAG: response regulator [Planctomycetes bacterium]|nr:response regulator [Planctomycetota bacterium]